MTEREQSETSRPAAVPAPRDYQPPRLNELGRWQAVTLIQSVPINPGSVLIPGQRQ